MKLTAIGIALVFLLGGCATGTRPNFQDFPREPAAFELCPEELRAQYADIVRFDGPYFGFFRHIVPMEGLINAWGEPDRNRISWWNLEPPLILAIWGLSGNWLLGGTALVVGAHPHSVYVWRKGHYLIESVVDHPIVRGYKPYMVYWKWYYQGNSCLVEK